MLHSILSVLAGYAVTAAIVIIGTMLAVRLILGTPLTAMRAPAAGAVPKQYLQANLAVSALAALAGGWVAARVAGHDSLYHGLALAGFMVLMGFLSMKREGAGQPRWYQLTLLTVMPAIAVLGAWLR